MTKVPLVSNYTYSRHLRAELMNNIFIGIFGVFEVVGRKTLGASGILLVILVSAQPASHIFAFFWSYIMEGRNKTPFIIVSGLITRGALIATAMVTDSTWFVLVCVVVFLSDTVYIPAFNSIMQANYDPRVRGQLLGRVARWSRFVMIPIALGMGFMLDRDPYAYRYMFPIAAVAGFLSYLQVALIRVRYRPEAEKVEPRRFSGFLAALKNFRRLLKENPDFDAYERNFMLYGVAFMILLPTHVLLLVDHLKMSYGEITTVKMVIFWILVAAFAPLAGKLFDRFKTIRSAGAAFFVLAFYPISLYLAFVTHDKVWAYVAYVFFGISMAGVLTAWQLGAMHFSGRKDAAAFMGVHVTAVGFRGLCAPAIGYVAGQVFDLGVVCLASAALFFLGSFLMFVLARRTS